ncbi:MAG: UDP-glucuronic acid decarboxylase family protein [Candidatus Sericytochromatia bacterium]|nr:UDP-glucuronic acid decarboxylase family protein [Candidatus Sericytochromatia bacterium]
MARALVAGGAGFVGSHLVDALLAAGHEVVAVDNLCTGRRANLDQALASGRCSLVEADLSEGLPEISPCDTVWHLASPASPPDYGRMPIETLRVGSEGTRHLLEASRRWQARFLLASTSEVYGDPQVHPQTEGYWGNVNPIGWRSCYDEAKRYAEALTMAYRRTHGLDTRIVRIFNTYGPRMRADDGRVVSNFICQALEGQPLTLYGTGDQTRSFQYVSDLVAGLQAWMAGGDDMPVNLGNPGEFTIRELADTLDRMLGLETGREHRPLPPDDPRQRRPDITRATATVGWKPVVPLAEGLDLTADWFRQATDRST